MDFGSVIHTAQKNGQSTKKEIKYYSTKFEPPKKEKREKTLSANIQKFLQRKEEEEKKKQDEERRKKEQLLALRAQDKKASRRVNVMLKRTKSSNKSVIQDAIDNDNTSVTLAGPSQPDEDDYGYVSQSAADYYNKMMEKYSSMPEEPSKFSLEKRKASTNLKNSKDRLKTALDKEEAELNGPRKRKRKHKDEEGESGSKEDDGDGDRRERDREDRRDEDREKEKKKERPKLKAAPVINFSDLLKIAEKKQFEPIVVEAKKEDEERPMTKKQRREMEREKERKLDKERREQRREQQQQMPPPPTNKIPKLNGDINRNKIDKAKTNNNQPSTSSLISCKSKSGASNSNINKDSKILSTALTAPKKSPQLPYNEKQKLPSKSNVKPDVKVKVEPKTDPVRVKQEPKSSKDLKPKQFPPPDVRRGPTNDERRGPLNGERRGPANEVRRGPSNDVRRGPPNDLRRQNEERRGPPNGERRGPPMKKKPLISKGKFYDDDDEDYDSEMDDFIDDGPEGEEDYSKYISEIFGYDKRKYRQLDDDVDDMETSFAAQMKEEVISAKYGMMEDLEEMKKEEEHNRQKAQMKKKMQRR